MKIPTRLKLQTIVCVIGALFFVVSPGFTQTNSGFTVEVVVADPGTRERDSAYWLALDRVLSRDLPDGSVDDPTRSELLREPARYVQAYRYRPFVPTADTDGLATRQVREGAPPNSVIAVTFPATLLNIIQRQNQPIEIVEEAVLPGNGNILALIAVEQDGSQFIIGGSRGQKFQSRLLQLGAANNLSFEFPLMDNDDLQLVQPANVLYNETQALNSILEKYNTGSRITGALVRVSATAWQSEWRLEIPGKQPRVVNLTTQTLDEALITAVTEIAGTGDHSSISSAYLASDAAFQRSGVALRVENLNSLAHYEQALELLRTIDPQIITESLEPGYTVFRAPSSNATALQQRLSRQSRFIALPQNGLSSELIYQFQ